MDQNNMPRSGSKLERRGVVRLGLQRGRSQVVSSLLVLLSLCLGGLGDITHVVIRGDTISALAKRYGVSSKSLAQSNGVTDPRRLQIGTRLVIPGGSMPTGPLAAPPSGEAVQHRVTTGENLSLIARHYGSTVDAIVGANGLKNASYIRAGQVLTVPVSGDATVERLLERYSARYGVDPALVKGVAWQESGWKQSVVSSAGAVGIMQVMPETGSFVSRHLLKEPADINDSEQNIKVGVRFLAFLLKHTGGDERTAVAGYFQGLRSVRQKGVSPTTERYVANVMALRGRFGGT